MFFARDAGRYKDAQMTDALMNRIYNGLPVRSNFVDILVQVENPAERLGRRRDVVALREKHHHGPPEVSKVDCLSVGRLNPASRKLVADEQLIDDKLNFLGIEIDMTAPPALKA